MFVKYKNPMIRLYIDKQQHIKAVKKPFRLRVMKGINEAISMYFATEEEAKRAKKFARKILNIKEVLNENI